MNYRQRINYVLIFVFLGIGLLGGTAFATKYVQVKLGSGTVYNFNYSGFDMGWVSNECHERWYCDEYTISMDDLLGSSLDYNWDDVCNPGKDEPSWMFDLMKWEDPYSIEVYYETATPYLSGTLLGTSTPMSIDYWDVAWISFKNTDCASNFQLISYTGYLSDVFHLSDAVNNINFIAVGYQGVIATSSSKKSNHRQVQKRGAPSIGVSLQ